MKISIYGIGYVGLVTGVCLAELGHNVCCMDIDASKVEKCQQGVPPIHEDQLPELLIKHLNNGHLQFTTDIQFAVNYADLQMIAVGTPATPEGSANLEYVETVAEKIAQYMQDFKLIITKSTVPVGTTDRIAQCVENILQKRGKTILFEVASNPEFLREGRAIADCLQPDRIIVGTKSPLALNLLKTLYEPLLAKNFSFLAMSVRSAELTKYAANAFLATKISFMNEMSQLAEAYHANIQEIQQGLGLDSRISAQFLEAGCGFGGSCFPKDVLALKHMAEVKGIVPQLLAATLAINHTHQRLLFDKLLAYFKTLQGKTIAMWGLAFKPNTDDIRSATSCVLMDLLFQAGAKVQAYDPLAMQNIAIQYKNQANLQLCPTAEAALDKVDALLIVTEWPEFKQYPLARLIQQPIFDGRALFELEAMQALGATYYSIGRPNSVHWPA